MTENHKTEDRRPKTENPFRRVVTERRGEGLVYLDREADRAYRRVVGGLAWPNPPQPGYLVVVGEAWQREIVSGERPLWLLAELEAGSVPQLSRKCRELGERFQAGPWYGDPGNLPFMRLLRLADREVEGLPRLEPITLSAAPYYDDAKALRFYVQMIRDMARVEKKILHLGQESHVAGRLMTLDPEDLGARAADYPPLAALGYAVSSLRVRKPVKDRAANYLKDNAWRPY